MDRFRVCVAEKSYADYNEENRCVEKGGLPSNPVNPEVLSQKIITMDRKNRECGEGGEDAILQKLSN